MSATVARLRKRTDDGDLNAHEGRGDPKLSHITLGPEAGLISYAPEFR